MNFAFNSQICQPAFEKLAQSTHTSNHQTEPAIISPSTIRCHESSPTFNLRASIKTCLFCWLLSISLFATSTVLDQQHNHCASQITMPKTRNKHSSHSIIAVCRRLATYFILFLFRRRCRYPRAEIPVLFTDSYLRSPLNLGVVA